MFFKDIYSNGFFPCTVSRLENLLFVHCFLLTNILVFLEILFPFTCLFIFLNFPLSNIKILNIS